MTSESEHFDRLVAESGSTWWGDRTPAAQVREASRLRLMASMLRPTAGAVFLEVGCGIGNITARIADLYPRHTIYAMDVSPGAIAYARESNPRPNITYMVADAANVRGLVGEVDFVVGRSILHHLPDVAHAVARWYDALSRGGAIFFSEPNPWNPHTVIVSRSSRLRALDQWSEDEEPIPAPMLDATLRRAGFTGVTVRPFDFVHPAFPLGVARLIDHINPVLCRIPAVRWLAGSLIVHGTKR